MVGNGIVDSEPSIDQNRTEFFGNRLWNGNRLGRLTLCDTAANTGHFTNCDFPKWTEHASQTAKS